MRNKVVIAVAVVALSTATMRPAAAGIADTPLLLLNGTTEAKIIYTVLGVVDSPQAATSFHCTSTVKTGGPNIVVGIELFDNGVLENDVTSGVGVEVISPGDTDIISTRGTSAFSDFSMGGTLVVAGSARILATSRKLICIAFLLDPTSNPPSFITTLPVFKKLRQKGE